MAVSASPSVTVVVKGGESLKVPITVKTRVWQLRGEVARLLDEVPEHVRLEAFGKGLDPLARVVALGDVQLTATLCGPQSKADDSFGHVKTPRLRPAISAAERMRITVRREGCADVRPMVNPEASFGVLRDILDLHESHLRFKVGKAMILDEQRTFQDLQLGASTIVSVVECEAVSHQQERTRASARDVVESFEFEDDGEATTMSGSGRHSVRRRFARKIKILFADPDDDNFTYEIDVFAGRSVSALLQFVEEDRRYRVLCDGREVPLDATFLTVTEGYDGSLFTFEPTAARMGSIDGVPPLSHLTRPFSPRSPSRSISRHSHGDLPTTVL